MLVLGELMLGLFLKYGKTEFHDQEASFVKEDHKSKTPVVPLLGCQ
jgi:hypothetical protein